MTVSVPDVSPASPPSPLPGAAPVAQPLAEASPLERHAEPVFAPALAQPHVHLGFWQQPWVQNVLPFATSVVFHLALILIGIATYQVVKKTVQVVQEQIIIPESTMADQGPPGGVAHMGAGVDPTRDAAQDIADSSDNQSWATKASNNLNQAALGGAENQTSMIAVGANAANGGQGGMAGLGDNTGQLAPFNVPGGGGADAPRSSFLGVGGNARKIVYVCQSSGTMLSVFGDLKFKLKQSIEALKPIQSFNVIFFGAGETLAFSSNGLVMASPENKRKVYDFIDNKVIPVGSTEPLAAIRLGLSQRPELMYVLTDGFPKASSLDEIVRAFRTGNDDKTTHVDCLYLNTEDDPKLVRVLQQIARENGGVMKIIPKLGF